MEQVDKLAEENAQLKATNQRLVEQCNDFYDRLRFIHQHMEHRKARLTLDARLGTMLSRAAPRFSRLNHRRTTGSSSLQQRSSPSPARVLLARPPAETAIADIMVAVNDPARKPRPVAARPGAGSVTEYLWEEVDNRIYLFLNSVTLADVCEKRVLGLSGMMHQKAADAPAARLPAGNSGGDDGVEHKPRARARR